MNSEHVLADSLNRCTPADPRLREEPDEEDDEEEDEEEEDDDTQDDGYSE